MERGNSDRLCSLLPPERPLSVLDATFGQGGDSTVMSWFLGEEGKVTSLEKSTVLYEIGRVGLSSFDGGYERMTRALRRIHLLHEDFSPFLQRADPKSFDVINSLNLATTIPTLIPSCVIFPSITFIFCSPYVFYFYSDEFI